MSEREISQKVKCLVGVTSDDPARKTLMHICLAPDGSMAATDSYMLVVVAPRPDYVSNGDTCILLPAKLAKRIGKAHIRAAVNQAEGRLTLTTEDAKGLIETATVAAHENAFPNYKRLLLSKGKSVTIQLDPRLLKRIMAVMGSLCTGGVQITITGPESPVIFLGQGGEGEGEIVGLLMPMRLSAPFPRPYLDALLADKNPTKADVKAGEEVQGE